MVSGFWFLVSGFWFLVVFTFVSGLKAGGVTYARVLSPGPSPNLGEGEMRINKLQSWTRNQKRQTRNVS